MAKKKQKGNGSSAATVGFEAKLWAAADALRKNMDAAEYNAQPRALTLAEGHDVQPGSLGELSKLVDFGVRWDDGARLVAALYLVVAASEHPSTGLLPRLPASPLELGQSRPRS